MNEANEPKNTMQDEPDFGETIECSAEFLRVWRCLPPQKKRIVTRKIALLAENPRHPSLRSHQLLRADSETWECYLIDSFPHRLLYQYRETKILLVEIGSHKVVNRSHMRRFQKGGSRTRC